MNKQFFFYVFLSVLLPVFSVDIFIYPKSESLTDSRYDHRWELLKSALEKTKSTHGEYIIKRGSCKNQDYLISLLPYAI